MEKDGKEKGGVLGCRNTGKGQVKQCGPEKRSGNSVATVGTQENRGNRPNVPIVTSAIAANSA